MENNNNNWQRCPVCNGSGASHILHGYMYSCGTCDGHGIISTLSGAPPGFKKYQTSIGSSIGMTGKSGPSSITGGTIVKKDIVYAVKHYKQTDWVAIFRNMDNADKFAKSISGGEWYVIDKVEVDINTFKKLL